MSALPLVVYLFGGAFLFNALPHLVSGLRGEPFQSPFAKPHGVGLSSSTVNALWGFFNLVVAYSLIVCVGAFDMRNLAHVLAVALGGLAISLFAARHFGQFHGGNAPLDR